MRGVDIVGTPLVSLTKIVATGDTAGNFQWLLRRGIRLRAGFRRRARHPDFRNGIAEERNFHGQAADPAAAGARSGSKGASTVKKSSLTIALLAACALPLLRCQPPRAGLPAVPARVAAAASSRAGSERQRSDAPRHARRNGTLAHAPAAPRRGQTLLHRIPPARSRRARRHLLLRRADLQRPPRALAS